MYQRHIQRLYEIESIFPCNRESEEFESIVSVRLEGLLKEAYALLEARKAEKQALAAKLKSVISILEEGGEKQ